MDAPLPRVAPLPLMRCAIPPTLHLWLQIVGKIRLTQSAVAQPRWHVNALRDTAASRPPHTQVRERSRSTSISFSSVSSCVPTTAA